MGMVHYSWREPGYMPKRIFPRRLTPVIPVEKKSEVIISIERYERAIHEPIIEHGVPIPPKPIINMNMYPLSRLNPGDCFSLNESKTTTKRLLNMIRSYFKIFPHEFFDEGKQFTVIQNKIYRTT